MPADFELLTTEEMAKADRLAVAAGVPSLTLMENAGRAIADEAMRMVSPGRRVPGRRIQVLCGPGNNGGDGFVAARLLKARGFDVAVSLYGHRDRLRGDAAAMAARWDGPIRPLIQQAPRPSHSGSIPAGSVDVPTVGPNDGLVIDALFGAGLRGDDPDGELRRLFLALSAIPDEIPVLAVDVPSGIDGSTGRSLATGTGSPGECLWANRTVTFFRRKPGHLLFPGADACGDVLCVDVGIPPGVLQDIDPQAFANDPELWRDLFPQPSRRAHKYNRGSVLVVSGGLEMSGAARLVARGALRVGAGLVTVAAPPSSVQAHAAQLNAVILRQGQTPDALQKLLADGRLNAVIIGPGLGRGDDVLAQITTVLASDAAVVCDADALTAIGQAQDEIFALIKAKPDRPVVFTPHDGEFGRVFDGGTGSKLERARAAAAMSGAIIMLKGPDTVVAAPDGRAAINANAPPYLATAGSGDVLAGILGGLIAQGMPAWQAAAAGVWLHGDCAGRFGPGLISEDLPEQLPIALRALLRPQDAP
ncbi:MAG: NAD(P)H-hydrate dehydratase [Pseudomonadota bacterium]